MHDIIPGFHFDTADLPAGTELAAWAAILPWFEVGQLDSVIEFGILADAWLLDSLVFSVTRMPPVWLERSSALIVADGRVDYSLIVATAPWFVNTGSTRVTLVEPGAVCVLDNSLPFRVENAGGEFIILNLPRPMLVDGRLPRALHGALFRNTLALVFGDFLRGLRPRLPNLAQSQTRVVARALRDLLVACLAAGAEPCWATQDESGVLHRARHYIDSNLASALTVAEVARAMGVSRSRLYRIFSEAGGVERFIMRRRLHRARAMLAHGIGPRPGIAEVAHATGFASTTHFSRTFKAEFAMTPTGARAMPAAPPSVSSHDARRFKSWFETRL